MSVAVVTVMETPAWERAPARRAARVVPEAESRLTFSQHCTRTNMSSIPIPATIHPSTHSLLLAENIHESITEAEKWEDGVDGSVGEAEC